MLEDRERQMLVQVELTAMEDEKNFSNYLIWCVEMNVYVMMNEMAEMMMMMMMF